MSTIDDIRSFIQNRSPGEVIARVVSYIDHTTKGGGRAIRRNAGRLLEEQVELCLEAGMTVGEIMERITDCVTKEASKAKKFPSELPQRINVPGIVVEIGDVEILTDYVRHLANISRAAVEYQKRQKLEALLRRTEEGEMVVRDHCLYKRMQWT